MSIIGTYEDDDFELVEFFKKKCIPQSKDIKKFEASRIKEFSGLMERGVFTPVHKDDAKEFRIYGSRFVDCIKHEGTPDAYEKSRLVVTDYNDNEKLELLTQAPTVQRASQRCRMALIASDQHLMKQLRDGNQAFVQARTKIGRNIFNSPPKVLGYAANILFLVNYPRYGIPESGNHWFYTYHNYHTGTLKMIPSVYDPCLLYTKGCMSIASTSENNPRGIVCFQTDDTAYGCNNSFHELEEKIRTQFDSKEIEMLTCNRMVKFNGGLLHYDGKIYYVNQPNHISNMKKLVPKSFTAADFISERARGSYIAAICRPDISFIFSVASQATYPTERDVKCINKAIEHCQSTTTFGLTFVPLDKNSIVCAVFVDAGFATNADDSSQLGFIMVLMEKHNNISVVYSGSLKSRRIIRSVLGAERFAMVDGFDVASTIRLTVNDILGRIVPLHVYTDSRSLFDSLTKISRTAKKRLLIDLSVLRQSYE